MRIRRWLVAFVLGAGLSGLGGAGCAGTAGLDAPYAGRTLVYEPGVPNFDLVASPTLQGGQPGIDCYLGVPFASLVFLPREGAYAARFETLFRLLDGKGKTLLAEYADVDTARAPDYESTQGFAPHIKQKRLVVDPGTYVLEVVLTDAQSKHQARRSQRVEVVAAEATRPVLSEILLEGRPRGAPFAPVLSLHVPAGLDSLRTVVDFFNAERLGDLLVTMRLLRFPSDTTAARPPYFYTIAPFFGLVRYDEADTLQVNRRRLQDLDPEIVIAFDLPGLEQGIYRVEVVVEEAARAGDEAPALLRRRDFAVRSADFPKITLLDEMIEALGYIAHRGELENLRGAATPEEKKRRFDAFWGTLVANRNLAANLLRHYYARVEEANLRYTTYKEGWKTDRGMIFILFGSPLYTDRLVDREVWYYSYDDRDAPRSFVFDRRTLYESEGLFEAFVLRRELYYEPEWRRAFDRWRRGETL